MKHFLLCVAVVVLATGWSSPAKAQFGLGGFGNIRDMGAEVDAMRTKQKADSNKYAKPQAHRRGAPTRSYLSNPTSTDQYGRMDLAGHPVAGYPLVRGDMGGRTPPKVSRGGANGHLKRGRAARRPSP